MGKHVNPYRVHDPENLLEVIENSSHPELEDCKRYIQFGGYKFKTCTEFEKFCSDEGINLAGYAIDGVVKSREYSGSYVLTVHIKPKHQTRNYNALRSIKA